MLFGYLLVVFFSMTFFAAVEGIEYIATWLSEVIKYYNNLILIIISVLGLKSQSKRAVSSTPPRPPSRRGRVMADKVGTSSSGAESSSKTISVPVFHLYHKLLPGSFNNCFYALKKQSFSVAVMSLERRYNDDILLCLLIHLKCRALLGWWQLSAVTEVS